VHVGLVEEGHDLLHRAVLRQPAQESVDLGQLGDDVEDERRALPITWSLTAMVTG